MKIVDFKCPNCGEVLEDIMVNNEEVVCPKCATPMLRIYGGFRKYKEYPEGFYENFENEPIYIKDREDFYKKCKEYDCHPHVPDAAKRKKKENRIRIFT